MKEGIHQIEEFFNGKRRFIVPSYQRNYAWSKEKQLKDFWDDIYYIDPSKKFFMGTILLRKADNVKDESGFHEFEQWEIIDGQQRILTLSIFIKVALKILQDKIEKDKSLEIKVKEQISKEVEKKLESYVINYGINIVSPLGDDLEYFSNIIVNFVDLPDETITPSQRRIKEAKTFFCENLKILNIKEIYTLLNKIDKISIVLYPVTERDEAVLIFETVNDRGKPLTNLEKTKSFLMYMIYLSSENAYKIKEKFATTTKNQKELDRAIKIINESETILRNIENKFGMIFRYLDSLEKIDFKPTEDDILRYHYTIWDKNEKGNYHSSFDYTENIKFYFRKVLIEDKKKIFKEVEEYIKSLELVFFALKEIYVDALNIRNEKYNNIRNILNKIILLDRLANFYPLTIAIWLKHNKDLNILNKYFECIEKYIFRVYIIGNKRSDTGINDMYLYAFQIFNNQLYYDNILENIYKLSESYIDNNDFDLLLKSHKFFNNLSSKETKYIFYHYEIYLRKVLGEPLELNLDNIFEDDFNIEHIIAQGLEYQDRPKNLRKDKIWEANIHKLGNLTLCTRYWNSSFGNKKFKLKKTYKDDKSITDKMKYKCYQNSIFKCQQELVNFDDFDIQQINERESKLIKFINNTWNKNK